jgi:hypothetical protein
MHTTYTIAELARLAEHEHFDRILDEAGVPNPPVPEPRGRKWSEGREFDASTFDSAAYEKYEAEFFKW